MISTWRVSGEFSISLSCVVHHIHTKASKTEAVIHYNWFQISEPLIPACTPNSWRGWFLCGKITWHWWTENQLFCSNMTQDLIPLKFLKINSRSLMELHWCHTQPGLSSLGLLLVLIPSSLPTPMTLQQSRGGGKFSKGVLHIKGQEQV